MQDLGVLPGWGGSSAARGISDAGQVVGYSGTAFLWDAAGGMQDLGVLPGGADKSYASDTNNVGQVVGYSNAATGRRAVLWDAAGSMQDLGDLPGGTDTSNAKSINDAGQVVGESNAATGRRAVLWDAVNGMQDLNDLIDPGVSAVLQYAGGINASGQIVGSGTIDGYTQAFLLTPIADVPVPAALPLMLGGIGLLAGRCRGCGRGCSARHRRSARPAPTLPHK
jgi:probable HAF family extracellular repeat protein